MIDDKRLHSHGLLLKKTQKMSSVYFSFAFLPSIIPTASNQSQKWYCSASERHRETHIAQIPLNFLLMMLVWDSNFFHITRLTLFGTVKNLLGHTILCNTYSFHQFFFRKLLSHQSASKFLISRIHHHSTRFNIGNIYFFLLLRVHRVASWHQGSSKLLRIILLYYSTLDKIDIYK